MIDALYDRIVRVYRSTKVDDGHGGFTTSPTLIATTNARVRPLSMREAAAGGFTLGATALRVYMGGDVDVRIGDEIRIDSADHSNVVRGVRDPQLQGHHLEVDAEEAH